jgi:hypothetical protein
LIVGFLLALSITNTGQAQWLELGLSTGVTSYVGDIPSPVGTFQWGAAGAAYAKYNFNPHWGLKMQWGMQRIYAADSLSGVASRDTINLSFRNNIRSALLQAEFNFWPFVPGSRKKKSAPYVGLGIGRIVFDPQAKYRGNWVSLQPLGTEGQGLDEKPGMKGLVEPERYALGAWTFPVTLGFRHNLRDKHSIGIEFVYCYTSTDYLDDIKGKFVDASLLRLHRNGMSADLSDRSWENDHTLRAPGTQRGVNAYNDAYWSLMVNYSHSIPSRRCRM